MIKHVIMEGQSRLSPISVDDQIDSILINFETESTVTQENKYSVVKALQFLFEQDTDEETADKETADEEAAEEDKATTDKSKEDTEGSETVDVSEPVEPVRAPLNLNEFATNVARLIDNYENLLDVRTVIMTRALQYITEHYGEESSGNLRDLLESQYNIKPTGDYVPEPVPPMAVGAGKLPA